MPVVWSALWRNRTESVLTLLALSVAFTLFSVMIAINAAYERAIDDTRIDRLIVSCAFDCGTIPLGYREQLARIGGVSAVGGELWVGGGKDSNEHHLTTVTFMDEGMRSAWPELPMTREDWRALDISPTGIFLTRTAAARRNARIGDTMMMNAGPGSGTDGSGTWFFTVLGFIADPTGWGQQWSSDMIIGNLRYFENSGNRDERDLVNYLRVAVDRPEHARAVCREIEARFTNATPAVSCVPAKENAEELMDADINMRQISLGIGAAGLFMILFLCANGTAESVRERLSEFGILQAIGFGNGRIAWLVILEAAAPTIMAALIGSAVAPVVGMFLSHLAIKGVINIPAVRASPVALGWALAAALLIALLSAVAPLCRLLRTGVAAMIARR